MNKEWTIAAVVGVIGLILAYFIGPLWRWYQNRKIVITVFQDNNRIKLFNGGKSDILIYFVSFTLKDILSPKDLARPATTPVYNMMQRPVKSGASVVVAEMGQNLNELVSKYTEVERKAFEFKHPGLIAPVMLGIDISVECGIVGRSNVQRTTIQRILIGYIDQGLAINMDPYGKERNPSTRLRFKHGLHKFFEQVKDPAGWYQQRKNNRFLKARLTIDAIYRSLCYHVIDREDAERRIKIVKDSLDKNQRKIMEQYINGLS